MGGTTVSALVCAEGDAFIYLASPCLHALALNHRPSHIHSHPNVYTPHLTPLLLPQVFVFSFTAVISLAFLILYLRMSPELRARPAVWASFGTFR